MAFPADGSPLQVEGLTARWLARLTSLVPEGAIQKGRLRAGQVITRDNINLLFREDQDDKPSDDREGEE